MQNIPITRVTSSVARLLRQRAADVQAPRAACTLGHHLPEAHQGV
jgi:hypothetical protein